MNKIIDFIDKTPVTKFCSSMLLIAMAAVMCLNVILRYVFHFSFNWGEEILRYMCIYMAFMGTAAGWRYGTHIGVTLFVEKVMPEKIRKYVRLLGDIIAMLFMGIVTYFGIILATKVLGSGQTSPAMHIPMFMIYGIVPLCGIISVMQMLIQMFKHKSYLIPRED